MTWPRGRIFFANLTWFALTLGLLSNTASAEIQLSQSNGEILHLPAPAKRIITLAPHLAELVYTAGAGEQLKAVVEYSLFPEAVKELPKVGNAFRIDLEQIIQLEPDLIIAWESGNPQIALQKLEQLGIVVWQIELSQPDEIAEAVESIAYAAGTESHGLPAAAELREKLAQLQRDNIGKPPIEYFFQIAAQPLYTVNGQHIISQSLAICGAKNVFFGLPTLAPQVSRESVVLADPQVMIATEIAGQSPSLDVWLDWPRLQAVQNNHLLYLPANEISQATPRLLNSIELACKLLDDIRSGTRKNEH